MPIYYETELYHYGVPGMKWGKRKARGHAGPGDYVTRKRQLAGDKRDLEGLKKGQHLSVGFTKKRQAALDARDKAALEKRITKNEKALADKKQFSKDGSEKTAKKLQKLLDTDKKYGGNQTALQKRHIDKLYKQYDKSAAKDIKKAIKSNDAKAVNSISAGRTYMKMLKDSNYFNRALSDAAIQANVTPGKNFSYKFARDNSRGGVTITVNGTKSTYAYAPDRFTKKKLAN